MSTYLGIPLIEFVRSINIKNLPVTMNLIYNDRFQCSWTVKGSNTLNIIFQLSKHSHMFVFTEAEMIAYSL